MALRATNLVDLPSEILAQILSGDVSHQALRLWTCGCAALNIKLANGGVQEINLEDRKWRSTSKWPKLVSRAFKKLRKLHISRGIDDSLGKIEGIRAEIMRLPSELRVLSLAFSNAEEAFIPSSSGYISFMMGDEDPYDACGESDTSSDLDAKQDEADDRFYNVLAQEGNPADRVAKLMQESRLHRVWNVKAAFPRLECLAVHARKPQILETDLARFPDSLVCLQLSAYRNGFGSAAMAKHWESGEGVMEKAKEVASVIPKLMQVFHWGHWPASESWHSIGGYWHPPPRFQRPLRTTTTDVAVQSYFPETITSLTVVNLSALYEPQTIYTFPPSITDITQNQYNLGLDTLTASLPAHILTVGEFRIGTKLHSIHHRLPARLHTLKIDVTDQWPYSEFHSIPTSITKLTIRLTFTPQDLESGQKLFHHLPNLKHLHLEGTIGFDYLEHLPTQLETLHFGFELRRVKDDQDRFYRLKHVFDQWTSLRTLTIVGDIWESILLRDMEALPRSLESWSFRAYFGLVDPSIIVLGLPARKLRQFSFNATTSKKWESSWFIDGPLCLLTELTIREAANFDLSLLAHLPRTLTRLHVSEVNEAGPIRTIKAESIWGIPRSLTRMWMSVPSRLDPALATTHLSDPNNTPFPPSLVALRLPYTEFSLHMAHILPRRLKKLKVRNLHFDAQSADQLQLLPRNLRVLEGQFAWVNADLLDKLPPHVTLLTDYHLYGILEKKVSQHRSDEFDF